MLSNYHGIKQMAQSKYTKKLLRVIKRRFVKPLLYAIGASFAIYFLISNVVTERRYNGPQIPQFTISRITDKFDETEFMHLLLTIQEIEKFPNVSEELITFVNGPFPGRCPKLLQSKLKMMNWAPQAFLIRVKTLFRMYEIHDRIVRMDETIAFLSEEIKENRIPYALTAQVEFLQKQRAEIIGKELTEKEYNFIEEYGGIVQSILRNNVTP